MPQRFIRRSRRDKFVRTSIPTEAPYTAVSADKVDIPPKNDTEMNDNVDKLKDALGITAKTPKRRVKVEKKDKGLIERTEESTILITEDNKMVLND